MMIRKTVVKVFSYTLILIINRIIFDNLLKIKLFCMYVISYVFWKCYHPGLSWTHLCVEPSGGFS